MTTTRRPKLLRAIQQPGLEIGVGTLGTTMGHGAVFGPTNSTQGQWVTNETMAEHPDWFAWVDVCDDCGKEVCTQRLCADAVLPRLRYQHDLCHGHAPKLPYPVGDDEPGYWVAVTGEVFSTAQTGLLIDGIHRWRTREDAEEFARECRGLASGLRYRFNVEASRK